MSEQPPETFVDRVVRELRAFLALWGQFKLLAVLVLVVGAVVAVPHLKELLPATEEPSKEQRESSPLPAAPPKAPSYAVAVRCAALGDMLENDVSDPARLTSARYKAKALALGYAGQAGKSPADVESDIALSMISSPNLRMGGHVENPESVIAEFNEICASHF